MQLLQATCECGFHSRKARAGYHFHQWWFPVLDTRTGELTDISRSLAEEDVDRIQVGQAPAHELHRRFLESETQKLLRHFAGQSHAKFNPDIGVTVECPRCHQATLRLGQVHVTAFCKTDCGREFPWPDSEQQGCPVCHHRPHHFRIDAETPFLPQVGTKSACSCFSSLHSASPADAYCPKCGKLPCSYEVNGQSFCGTHHIPMEKYMLPRDYLFREASAQWVKDQFPNAKLWGDSEGGDSLPSSYCPQCELDHQRWLTENPD